MSTDPTTATPSYNPLHGEQRFSQPEWIRRNTGAYAPSVPAEGGMVQEIDPNYRERSYSFRDIMESFNPIQHIPVLGHLYRQATGTQLHPVARVLGGAATGPLGVVSALANTALESATGRDLSGHILHAVAPQRDGAANTQLAGGSYIYDPVRNPNAPTAPGANDFTANMAQAPQPDLQGPARTQRRNRRQDQDGQQAAPTAPANPAAAVAAAAVQPAAGSAVPAAAVAGGATGTPPQPGILLAQAVNAPSAAGAAAAPGRSIQQYIVMGGLRPQGGDVQRPVQNTVPARNVPSFRPPTAIAAQAAPRGDAPAAADGAAATAPGAGSAAPSAAAGENTWFTAAMLHGVDRYREARRAQSREAPRVDVSE